MSPYHFHRVFKAVAGVTPKAYADARRAKRLRDELAHADGTVTAAIYDAGFNSSGRFYETADQVLGMKPTAYRAGGANTEIRFAIGECSLGSILVASRSEEHTSELQSLMRISYAVFCLKKKKLINNTKLHNKH